MLSESKFVDWVCDYLVMLVSQVVAGVVMLMAASPPHLPPPHTHHHHHTHAHIHLLGRCQGKVAAWC